LSFIRKVEPEDADGRLERIYEAARSRAGRVFEILKLQSLRPDILESWIGWYRAVMLSPSGLTRIERELVAAVVSKTNGCHY
jgi:alkylhydroperoxidase family enzyme